MQDIWLKDINKFQKRFIILLLVSLIVMCSLTYFKKSAEPVVTETTVAVGRGDVKTVISATGTILPVNSIEISSRVTGLIKDVKVNENDKVKTGDVLVILDDSSVRAQVAQYHAQLLNYAGVYERSKKLAAVGGESLQQLDSDRTNYLTAKSTYDNFLSQLDYYVIRAPIDGMVIGKPTPAGQTVAQGISAPQVIMTIADMSQMQIKVLVDETDIGRLKVGQDVSFTVDAYYDKIFTGKVRDISRSATISSNVVYYPVYVDVDSAQELLYPTMTARVTISVGESSNVLVVPLSAVKEDKGQKYIQLMVDGRPKKTAVKLGLRDEEKVEIVNGLNEGDRIQLPAAKPKSATIQNLGPPPAL